MKFIIDLIIYIILVWFMCRFFKVTSECDDACEYKFDERGIRNIDLDDSDDKIRVSEITAQYIDATKITAEEISNDLFK